MVEPTGYTALDMIGFTDKGQYDPLENYVKNDIVHDADEKMWLCKVDDTRGVTPAEGVSWTKYIAPPVANPETIGIGYGTCSTAASTTAKEVTLSGYNLKQNGYVSVLFTYAVPASATLNVNSKGAKPIYYHGSAITADIIGAGDLATFVYDGTNYNFVGVDNVSSQIQALANNVNILQANGNWRTGLRFKNLGTSFTQAQADALANDDFSEFWNGDYWEIGGRKWLIVDNSGIARRKGVGDSNFDSPSLIIMPEHNLIDAEAYLIDNADNSVHGYLHCAYRTRTDGKGTAACKSIIENAFGASHIAAHKELMSSGRGANGATGWSWGNADVELPSEVNIYGHNVWAKSNDGNGGGGYNIGSIWGQFMLFKLAPYMEIDRTKNYWLRDIVNASYFAYVSGSGNPDSAPSSYAGVGLRPYFILK